MPISEARKRANKKWNDAHLKERYDRVQLVLPAGRKQALEAYAASYGESVNGLINRLIRENMGISEEDWKGKPEQDVPLGDSGAADPGQ